MGGAHGHSSHRVHGLDGGCLAFLARLSMLSPQVWYLLGKHLTVTTRDRILRGEYMDVFSLLFRDLRRKDKDDLDDCLKEQIKRRMIDQTYPNWYPGFLIYVGFIVWYQPWQALSMLQYMDIIYKTYTDFPSPSWLQYDEQFCMQDAMNPMLC